MRWERVEQLADRAPRIADLRFHRLELVAARRLRERGADVPPELGDAERLAAVMSMAAPVVLRRARAAYDGPMALMKGPEIAVRYPDAALRPYRDLDLLVGDAAAAHRALLHAGFAPAGMWAPHAERHHTQPLHWPGLPIGVELHRATHVPAGMRAPTARQLLADVVPARFDGGGVDAPSPAAHTLVVAAHAWVHEPLGRIGQLVDVALLASEADPDELAQLARHWGFERLWRVTSRAIEVLLHCGGRSTAAMRVCAPHLRDARERTLLERHVEELASPLFGLRARPAIAASASVATRLLRRGDEETWAHKARRTLRAAGDARLRHSEHDERLAPEDLRVGALRGLRPAPIVERRRVR